MRGAWPKSDTGASLSDEKPWLAAGHKPNQAEQEKPRELLFDLQTAGRMFRCELI
jgi:hypothetical protein